MLPATDKAFRQWLGKGGSIQTTLQAEKWRDVTEGRWNAPAWRDMAKEKGIEGYAKLTRKTALELLVRAWQQSMGRETTPLERREED